MASPGRQEAPREKLPSLGLTTRPGTGALTLAVGIVKETLCPFYKEETEPRVEHVAT